MSPETPSPMDRSQRPAEIPRRGFLTKAAAAVIGAVVALVPFMAGLLFFLDPLRRRSRGSAGGGDAFVRVTTTDVLESLGSRPEKFTVTADRRDAWTFYPDQRIGNVILRKASEGPIDSGEDVVAFSDICPHLGCTVDYRESNQGFYCPCHASTFSLAGERTNRIPPRNLDRLPVEIRNGNEVWVKYERFQAGITVQKAIG